ncbi:hypothetical protein GCM10009605_06110 [Nocardiopsis composta]
MIGEVSLRDCWVCRRSPDPDREPLVPSPEEDLRFPACPRPRPPATEKQGILGPDTLSDRPHTQQSLRGERMFSAAQEWKRPAPAGPYLTFDR